MHFLKIMHEINEQESKIKCTIEINDAEKYGITNIYKYVLQRNINIGLYWFLPLNHES